MDNGTRVEHGIIKIAYKGYDIIWSDNGEYWYCNELDDYGGSKSSDKVSTVKAKIDAMTRSVRKESALTCWELASKYDYRAKITPATIVEFLGDKKVVGDSAASPRVAVVARRDGSDKASRRSARLEELMPDRADALKAFTAYKAACADVAAAQQRATDLYKAIPRVTIDMIEPLVKIAGGE